MDLSNFDFQAFFEQNATVQTVVAPALTDSAMTELLDDFNKAFGEITARASVSYRALNQQDQERYLTLLAHRVKVNGYSNKIVHSVLKHVVSNHHTFTEKDSAKYVRQARAYHMELVAYQAGIDYRFVKNKPNVVKALKAGALYTPVKAGAKPPKHNPNWCLVLNYGGIQGIMAEIQKFIARGADAKFTDEEFAMMAELEAEKQAIFKRFKETGPKIVADTDLIFSARESGGTRRRQPSMWELKLDPALVLANGLHTEDED